MSINWFPGHMHKARKEIAKAMSEIDLIIELLDARLPFSSENPLVSSLRKDKPVIKLLNKSDLADISVTDDWLVWFNSQAGMRALAIEQGQSQQIGHIRTLCQQLAPARAAANRPVRVLVMGIPNVGKSTLINALLERVVAKVGNEPAVTKIQQRFTTFKGIALSDTPGILWPKIKDVDSGYRLAISGAIKDTAIDHQDIALYAARFLYQHYPARLAERFDLDEIDLTPEQIVEHVGRRRGCLRSGGIVDFDRASSLLLNELRSGKLGTISFETVDEWKDKIELEQNQLNTDKN